MNNIRLIILSASLIFLLVGCENIDDSITQNAQYIEHGGTQLYNGDENYGVIYIYLGDNYSIGNVNSYKIEDISLEEKENSEVFFEAEEFNFKNGILCIPVTDVNASINDTLLFKHRNKSISYLSLNTIAELNSINLS